MRVASQKNHEIDNNALPLRNDRESRPWGEWEVLKQGEGYKAKLIVVHPGHRLSLQYHKHRSEHWIVVSGRARVVIGNETRELGLMQTELIPTGVIHRIENPFEDTLRIIEVQQGSQLLEEDIVRLEDDYARATGVAS